MLDTLRRDYPASKPISQEDALRLSRQFLQSFWSGGDLLNPQGHRPAYEALAVVEMALAQHPKSEELYRQAEETIASFTPVMPSRTDRVKGAMRYIDRGMELFANIALRHFDSVICHKPAAAVTISDLAVIYDYIYYAPEHVGREDYVKLIAELRGKRPSRAKIEKRAAQLESSVKKDVRKRKAKMLDWALSVSVERGWKPYAAGFRLWKQEMEKGRRASFFFGIYAARTDPAGVFNSDRFSRRPEVFWGLHEPIRRLHPPAIEINPNGVLEPGSAWSQDSSAASGLRQQSGAIR
jgi:hypothetical protein